MKNHFMFPPQIKLFNQLLIQIGFRKNWRWPKKRLDHIHGFFKIILLRKEDNEAKKSIHSFGFPTIFLSSRQNIQKFHDSNTI